MADVKDLGERVLGQRCAERGGDGWKGWLRAGGFRGEGRGGVRFLKEGWEQMAVGFEVYKPATWVGIGGWERGGVGDEDWTIVKERAQS